MGRARHHPAPRDAGGTQRVSRSVGPGTDAGRGPASDTVPLGVGFIAAYIGRLWPEGSRVRLFRYPDALARALEEGPLPDLIGFSSYLWNTRLSRSFAVAIKRRSPATLV